MLCRCEDFFNGRDIDPFGPRWRIRLEDRRQEDKAVSFELERTHPNQLSVGYRSVIPQALHDAQIVIVAKVAQNSPAYLHLELLDQDLLECLESVEIDALQGLLFTKVITTALKHQELLEGRDVIALQILVEDLLLENGQLLVVEVAVIVEVEDPKDAQKSLLEVGFEHFGHAVV